MQPLLRETRSGDRRKHKNWEQLKLSQPFSKRQECARNGVRHHWELTGTPVGTHWPAAILSSHPEDSTNN